MVSLNYNGSREQFIRGKVGQIVYLIAMTKNLKGKPLYKSILKELATLMAAMATELQDIEDYLNVFEDKKERSNIEKMVTMLIDAEIGDIQTRA